MCRGLACRRHVGAESRRQGRSGGEQRLRTASDVLPFGSPAVPQKPIDEPASQVQRGPPEAHGGQETLQGHGVRRALPSLVLRDRRPLDSREPGKVRLGPVERGPQNRDHPAQRKGLPALLTLLRSCHFLPLSPRGQRQQNIVKIRDLVLLLVVPEREKSAPTRVLFRRLTPQIRNLYRS